MAHFDASNVGAPGGGPGDDIPRASEICADDSVVEWPQGGERLRGKANIIAFRSVYPRIYFGDPWEPPAWRAQWVERFDPCQPETSVSAHRSRDRESD